MFLARRAALSSAVLALTAVAYIAAPSSQAAISWAPASKATVHPGVQTITEGAQCTANFVFTDGTNVYIGQAAHCSSTSGSTSTNGCIAETLPVGTKVEVRGASQLGTMVYNSWATMHALNESDDSTCAYNDFALVKLAAADIGRVNPSVPHWGGPTGLATSGVGLGAKVESYGNSSLRFGIQKTSPKRGRSLGAQGDGWSRVVYTVTPGIPGDSGSGFLDANGRAFGVLSTVAIAPYAGSNGVGWLAKELNYMRAHSSFGNVSLATGTVPFSG